MPDRRISPATEAMDGAGTYTRLRAMIRLLLEQDRVHIYRGQDARRLGLEQRRPADFVSCGGDVGVQGHILHLEGRDRAAVLTEYPAQGRHQQALAHRRPSALRY